MLLDQLIQLVVTTCIVVYCIHMTLYGHCNLDKKLADKIIGLAF